MTVREEKLDGEAGAEVQGEAVPSSEAPQVAELRTDLEAEPLESEVLGEEEEPSFTNTNLGQESQELESGVLSPTETSPHLTSEEGASHHPDLHSELRKIHGDMQSLHESLGVIGGALENLHGQQAIMQRGLRQLNVRLNDVATTISAPRIRELYSRLLLLYDLVEPSPAHLREEAVDFCRLLAHQIEEFLAVNGINLIETEGQIFNARYHKPVEQVIIEDTVPEGTIMETKRKGFRSENEVLRPAHVVIAQKPPLSVPEEKEEPETPDIDS